MGASGAFATAAVALHAPIGFSDAEEIGRLQAGAADERAVDIVHAQQFDRIGRLDRAAVENAYLRSLAPEFLRQSGADVRVRLGDIADRRRQAGAYRPYRLIGDDGVCRRGGRGNRTGDLTRQHVERRTLPALFVRLADADDCRQPGAPRGRRLGANHGVVLAPVGPAFRVADDDVARTRILQHLGRDAAGERAAFLRMAV